MSGQDEDAVGDQVTRFVGDELFFLHPDAICLRSSESIRFARRLGGSGDRKVPR
jgi:hypothetical protein